MMDTMTEEDEDERSGNMSGVVQTADMSGGFKPTDEREKASFTCVVMLEHVGEDVFVWGQCLSLAPLSFGGLFQLRLTRSINVVVCAISDFLVTLGTCPSTSQARMGKVR